MSERRIKPCFCYRFLSLRFHKVDGEVFDQRARKEKNRKDIGARLLVSRDKIAEEEFGQASRVYKSYKIFERV